MPPKNTEVISERLRDYAGPLTTTGIWDDLTLRADDVIVTTPPKCGTTWMLNIVMMLILGRADPDAGNRNEAPWLDSTFRDRAAVLAMLNGLTRRRCIKSHTPMDGINYAAEPSYIVVYRHPIDVHFSMRSHVANMKDNFLDFMCPDDVSAGFERFITAPLTDAGTDDLTVESLIKHYAESRVRAPNGNVHFFHYADMSRDLPGQVARLAGILGIEIAPEVMAEIAEANTFARMRAAVAASETRFDANSPFRDQAEFFAEGTSNKWQGKLDAAELAAFEARIAGLLPEEDIAWLLWGDARHG